MYRSHEDQNPYSSLMNQTSASSVYTNENDLYMSFNMSNCSNHILRFLEEISEEFA